MVKFETLNVAIQDLELTQIYVKTAFLYGEFDEEIYMELPIITAEEMSALSRKPNREGADVITALQMAANSTEGKPQAQEPIESLLATAIYS